MTKEEKRDYLNSTIQDIWEWSKQARDADAKTITMLHYIGLELINRVGEPGFDAAVFIEQHQVKMQQCVQDAAAFQTKATEAISKLLTVLLQDAK